MALTWQRCVVDGISGYDCRVVAFWSQGSGRGFELDYSTIVLHAVCRDTTHFPRPCIYCQLDFGQIHCSPPLSTALHMANLYTFLAGMHIWATPRCHSLPLLSWGSPLHACADMCLGLAWRGVQASKGKKR